MFDSHAHITSADCARYPAAGLTEPPAPETFDDPLTAERLLALMDAAGVARAMVVQKMHTYGFDNSYVVDAAAAHPKRLRAVCGVDGLSDRVGDDVRHWVGERGAVGVRMAAPWSRGEPVPKGDLRWLASESAHRAFAAAEDLGAFLVLHFYAWNREDGLVVLLERLSEFRELPVVIDHMSNFVPGLGQTPVDDPLLVRLAEFPNAVLKFSTINLLRWRDAGHDAGALMQAFVGLFGAGRICWGSDISNSPGSYDEMIASAQAALAALDAENRDAILSGTAAGLCGRAPARA
ncbi:amidohydrolase family protein [Parasphingopyxis marina]|uniref:Amidohydrolase n=1 Tax=Parasphingopyxis marina TaxID=2761622 RepID=A0A842I274_9SPHN|nr:amidohydrolase family protein [Parasphingopyxis marina]MBC2778921.1 amidohydrolase [Parasphingopyxis marina]